MEPPNRLISGVFRAQSQLRLTANLASQHCFFAVSLSDRLHHSWSRLCIKKISALHFPNLDSQVDSANNTDGPVSGPLLVLGAVDGTGGKARVRGYPEKQGLRRSRQADRTSHPHQASPR